MRRRLLVLVVIALIIWGVVLLIGRLSGPASAPADEYPDDLTEQSPYSDEGSERVSYYANDRQISPAVNLDAWYLILVNPWHALPVDFSVELEHVPGSGGFYVDARITDSIVLMFAAALEVGIRLELRSAYRSVNRQYELFYGNVDMLVNQGNTRERAVYLTEMYFARPGYSEHHTGLAVDILSHDHQYFTAAFENTQAFAWLSENAHLFGFILRYPRDGRDITGIAYEPWHFRYVGQQAALEIFETGMILEQFLDPNRQQAGSAAQAEGDEDDGNGYEEE